ncbi:hypothetical protein CDAR_428461 [Caerostris darwini]|uniref:Ribosomal protein L2 n=1 Tax=Caerostris darwini TaxID=1538125 RepID=A0AAV4T4W0_9ARAC|nr:hypothetical protein CDAR_428461 [Caerostris darwini]
MGNFNANRSGFRVAESSLCIETGTNKTKIIVKQGPHLQPPNAWIRVIRSLLAVPSRHLSQPPRWRSHQMHGSGSSVAYLQYRRGTSVNHRGGGGIGTVPYALIILRSSGDHF